MTRHLDSPSRTASSPRGRSRTPRTPRTARAVGTVVVLSAVLALLAFGLAVWSALAPHGAQLPLPSAVVTLLPGGALDEEDGLQPDRETVSVFDDDLPAVSNLDPELLAALRDAAGDAERDGVSFEVNSGWRSDRYQQSLLDDAVAEYGSPEEAARWVATPETSAHVSGDAIDLGPADATSWLSQHGARYGLCQIYANERWHYELRPDAPETGCPAMYADPTEDPRMQP